MLAPACRRFNGPQLGVWCAASELKTAIAETVYHSHHCLAVSASAFPNRIEMPELLSTPQVRLTDVRADDCLHAPDDYGPSQEFGEVEPRAGRDGILYRSGRRAGREKVAIYKPRRLLPVTQGDHFAYLWDQDGRVEVVRVTGVR